MIWSKIGNPMNQINKPLLGDRFEKALIYAFQLHSNQFRKGSGIPYISHLMSVAALVLEDGGDENQAIAALLHDAIEDQGGDRTRQEIKAKFGDEVSSIVEGCTETDLTPKPPWRQRKLASIAKLSQVSTEVRRVMLADKLHNARSILADWHRSGEDVWQRFKGGKDGTLWYFESIVKAVPQQDNSFLAAELGRVVNQLNKH